jgi:hypothetical protein
MCVFCYLAALCKGKGEIKINEISLIHFPDIFSEKSVRDIKKLSLRIFRGFLFIKRKAKKLFLNTKKLQTNKIS